MLNNYHQCPDLFIRIVVLNKEMFVSLLGFAARVAVRM